MGGEWKKVSLNDLYDVSSGLSKPASEFGSGYPFLAFKDVFNNYFVPRQLSGLVQSNEKEQVKCSIQRGDVFLTRTSETMHELGMSSVALKNYENATFNGFTKRLRPKEDNELFPEYVGYYLRSQIFRNEMLAFSTMSTRASLNNSMIAQLRMSVPPLMTQKSIAWILKKLDDKIELNRQMNKTLESMAQALFKSWFVDFDPVIDNALAAGNPIPDVFAERAEQRRSIKQQKMEGVDSKNTSNAIQTQFPSEFEYTGEMGWIPKGWEVSDVSSEYNTVGGTTPSTKNPKFWEGGDIYWTTPKDLSGSLSKVLLETSRKITKLGLQKISSGLLPVDTVLMSSRAPVGYLALAKVPVAINQGYIAIKCEKVLSSEYALLWANSIMSEIKQRAGGTTFAEISKKSFREIPVFVPGSELVQEYSKQIKDIYNQIAHKLRNNDSLTKLRDTLLPKLLSGELRIESVKFEGGGKGEK